MAEASNYLRDFLAAGEAAFDPKQSEVAAAAIRKKQQLSDEGYRRGASAGAGFGGTEIDISEDPLTTIARGSGRSEYAVDASNGRDAWETIGDVANNVAATAITGIPQIANIGLSVISPNASARVTEFISQGLENANNKKTEAARGRARAYGARQSVSSDHNETLYQEDLRSGLSSFEAGLRRVGRDALSSIKNSDDINISDTVATGLGSLLTAAPIGKALSILGKGAMPVAVGLQEGGAAHHSIVTQVLNTSHEDLMAGSEAYREAIQEGNSPEDAKNMVARNAGLQAAVMQGTAGALVGALPGFSKLEAAPFRVGSFKGSASNILKETLEESIQGATGATSENLAIRNNVDDRQTDLLGGVGESIGQGAVGGLGTAGVVQAPGMALRAAVATVAATTKAAIKGFKAITGRGANLAETATVEEADRVINEVSSVSADPAVRADVDAAIETIATEPNEVEEARAYVGKLFETLTPDKIIALNTAIQTANDENLTPEEQEAAALDILDMQSEIVSVLDAGVPKALETLEANDRENPLIKQVHAMRHAIGMLQAHPNVRAAMERADAKRQETLNNVETNNEIDNGETPSVRPNTPGPAPSDQIVSNTVRLATHRPNQVDSGTVTNILYHADQGDVSLTPEQRRPLEGAVTLAKAVQERKERARRLGLKTSEEVSNDIVLGKADSALEDAPSMATYLREVNQAMRAGNPAKAKARLKEMLDFTLHMQRKVGAINESLAKGGGKENQGSYLGRRKNGQMNLPAKFGVTPQSPESVRVVQAVQSDAKAIAAVANYLVQAYPELGLKPVKEIELHESLQDTAENVVAAYLNKNNEADKSERTSPETPSINTPSTTPEPADTGQPKGGDTSVEAKVETEAKPAKQAEAREDLAAPNPREKKEPTKVKLSGKSIFLAKDQAKSDKANKFIGWGSKRSSTRRYAKAWGENANSGKYEASDVVFISAEGARNGRILPNLAEIKRAIEAGVTFITDVAADRKRAYNKGEREVAEFLTENGYQEVSPGTWKFVKPKQEPKPETAPVVETVAKAIEEAVSKPSEETESEESEATPETGEPGFVEPNKSDIRAVYPNLIKGNWLHKHFSLKELGSRLVGLVDPIQFLDKLISSQKRAEEFAGKRLNRTITKPVVNGFQQLFAKSVTMYEMLNKRLEDRINKITEKGYNLEEAPTWIDGKTLNLTEIKEGKQVYNEELLQGALLAAINWVLTAGQQGRVYKDEDIADTLKIDESQISNTERMWFNDGIYLADTVDSLAANILRFWGMSQSNAAPDGETYGLTQSMAKELLVALENAGLIEVTRLDYEDGSPKVVPALTTDKTNDSRSYLNVKSKLDPKIKESTAEFPDMLEQLISTEPEPNLIINEPSTRVSDFQSRDRVVPATDAQKETQLKAQQTPHTLNTTMVSFLSSIGMDGALELFGYGGIEQQGNLNRKDWEAKQAFNRTVTGAFNYLQNMLKDVGNAAKTLGKSLEDIEIFYEYAFSKVGRLHAQGSYNPQANKLMRELSLPSRATIDLTDPKMHSVFMLAIGQHWGVKVNKLFRNSTLKEVGRIATTEYRESLAILRDWLKQNENKRQLSAGDIAVFQTEFGKKMAPGAMHAAIEYARWQNAVASKDKAQLSNFTTQLYVEADGVTDGPINSLMHLASGEFTPHWLQMMAKGGLFIGQGVQTLAGFLQSGIEKANLDLYTEGSIKVKERLIEAGQAFKGTPLNRQFGEVLYVMGELLGSDFSIDPQTGVVTIDRGLTKNPMTVTVYGSGERGLANKLVGEMLSNLYEKMSEGTVSQELIDAIAQLSNFKTVRRRDRSLLLIKDPQKLAGTGLDFELSRGQIVNIQENILHLFVPSLKQGIDEVIGGEVNSTKDALRRAIQVQSIIVGNAYRSAIQAAIKAKGVPGQIFLSQKEQDKIHADLAKKFNVLIKTDNQTFYPAGQETAAISDPTSDDLTDDKKKRNAKRSIEISRTLDSKLSTPHRVSGPGDAGVRGIPYIIIGSGDGQMIMNIIMDDNAPEGALYVFDGVNLKLSTAEADGETVNQAVLKGWMSNPIGAVSKAYSDFLEVGLGQLQELSEVELDKIKRAFFTNDPVESVDPITAMTDLKEILANAALESQARKNVLARVNLSIDHMASLEAPYVVTNKTEVTGTFQEIATQLNEMYKIELAKLKGEKVVEPEVTEPEAPTGVAVTPIRKMIRNAMVNLKMTANQRTIFQSAIVPLMNSGWQVVTGTKAEIEEYLKNQNTDVDFAEFRKVSGVTSVNDQTIYLINGTPEVTVHELLHAATLQTVYDYYEGNPVSAEAKAAIERIEQLKDQWLAETAENSSPEALNLRKVMARARQNESKAHELNEFMAWMLTNEQLIEQGQKITVLTKLKRKIIEAIKQLVFGRNASKIGSPGTDLYSNLRFNTQVVIAASQPSLATRVRGVAYHTSAGYGTNDRLAGLTRRLSSIVDMMAVSDSVDTNISKDKVQEALLTAQNVRLAYETHGFPMSGQEQFSFDLIVQMLATEVELDPNSLLQAQGLYDHVIKTLKVEDFMTDPTNSAERYYAEQKYNTVIGNTLVDQDRQGRSTLLPSFLALAISNNEFRNILINMPLPKGEKNKNQTLDAKLENLGTAAMIKLARTVSGEKGTDIRAAVDSLMARLSKTIQEQENLIVRSSTVGGNYVDKFNDTLVNFKDRAVDKAVDKLEDIEANSTNKYTRWLAATGGVLVSILSNERSEKAALGIMHAANQANLWQWPRELLNEIIGRTSENKNVYDLIKRVRSHIQQFRQQFREHLPEKIAEKFSRELSKDEWSLMFEGIAKTDVSMLRDRYTISRVIDFLKQPSLMTAEIAVLEGYLQRHHPNEAALFIQKSKELAEYMNTGRVTTSNLLRNSHVISELMGEVNRANAPRSTPALRQVIDSLTSMYAYEGTSQATKDLLSDLATNEETGIDFVLAQVFGSRTDEMTKVGTSSQALVNHFKGHVPNEQRPGVTVKIAKDVDRGKLELMGFTRVADYNGSQAENSADRRGYYFAPMSGKAPYSQGIMQNVRATASGVDPMTGFSMSSTAGTITDPYVVEQIRLRQRRNNGATENLMPVYDQNGKVIAWERSVEPNEMIRLEKNTQLHEVIGAWKGRQIEEGMADQFNHLLIDKLVDRYNEDVREGFRGDYVNIFDKRELRRDPVLADAVRLITPQTRAYIESQFEEGEFWVRRDMINDSIGYRSPSIGDAWTGNTRLNPEVTKQMRNFITGIFGKDAYKYAVTAEKFWQNFVADARTTIVVRSAIVPVANMISNIYHLAAVGVPLADIARQIPRKTAEINRYVSSRLEYMSIAADLQTAKVNNDTRAQRQAETKLRVIEDAWSRMSIWPLIDAGEFTSISDAGISQEETLLAEGKLTSYFEKLASKLPASVRTAGRYALVSKDTALFQGLQRSVAYGDFIAKAILFDDLTKRKKKSVADSLGRISEEFVNYDRLAGRSRSYLENTGFLWFWHFKIRAMKVAVSTIRNNPLHVLLSGLVPQPEIFGSIGSPITDNLGAIALRGDLHWSIGPGMGVNAYYLNPTVQILG